MPQEIRRADVFISIYTQPKEDGTTDLKVSFELTEMKRTEPVATLHIAEAIELPQNGMFGVAKAIIRCLQAAGHPPALATQMGETPFVETRHPTITNDNERGKPS